MTQLRAKQNSGAPQPFNQAYRVRRDELRPDAPFPSYDAILKGVAEKIVAGRKIQTYDAALVREVSNELMQRVEIIPPVNTRRTRRTPIARSIS